MKLMTTTGIPEPPKFLHSDERRPFALGVSLAWILATLSGYAAISARFFPFPGSEMHAIAGIWLALALPALMLVVIFVVLRWRVLSVLARLVALAPGSLLLLAFSL